MKQKNNMHKVLSKIWPQQMSDREAHLSYTILLDALSECCRADSLIYPPMSSNGSKKQTRQENQKAQSE